MSKTNRTASPFLPFRWMELPARAGVPRMAPIAAAVKLALRPPWMELLHATTNMTVVRGTR